MSRPRVRGGYAVVPLAVGLLAGCPAVMAQPVVDGHVTVARGFRGVRPAAV